MVARINRSNVNDLLSLLRKVADSEISVKEMFGMIDMHGVLTTEWFAEMSRYHETCIFRNQLFELAPVLPFELRNALPEHRDVVRLFCHRYRILHQYELPHVEPYLDDLINLKTVVLNNGKACNFMKIINSPSVENVVLESALALDAISPAKRNLKMIELKGTDLYYADKLLDVARRNPSAMITGSVEFVGTHDAIYYFTGRLNHAPM